MIHLYFFVFMKCEDTFGRLTELIIFENNLTKKGGWVDFALLYSRVQVGHCIIDGIKFEFNDI